MMMNKIICIYHSRDLDGWMSAAIVKKWHMDYLHAKVKENTPTNTLDFLGWDYGDEIPNMTNYDKVIMVDISFPGDVMEVLYDNNKLIWIDHHSSAIKVSNSHGFNHNKVKGIRDSDFAACELTWMYFFDKKESDKMPEVVRLLGRYDCFGHKGTKEEQKVLEFQYGARMKMKNYEDCYNMLNLHPQLVSDLVAVPGYHIYKYVCSEADQTYKKSFPLVFNSVEQAELNGREPKSKLHIHNFLAVNQERFNPINFGIDYHEDGYDGFACFWYKDGKWSWSLYNDDGKVDCSIIAKQYGGGGHKGASGFVVKNINDIIPENE